MKNLLLLAAVSGLAVTAFAFDPAATFADKCAKCHGNEGHGDTKMGKKLNIRDYTDAKVQAEFTDAQGMKAIKEGIADNTGKVRMKAIEGLSDDESKAMVAYFRTLKK
jgi:cytochrome c553